MNPNRSLHSMNKKPFNGESTKIKLIFLTLKKIKFLIILQKKETFKDMEKNLIIQG